MGSSGCRETVEWFTATQAGDGEFRARLRSLLRADEPDLDGVAELIRVRRPAIGYELTWSPSVATFKANTVFDIDYDHPFVVDVHISGSTCYLAGYPAGTNIYHYLAVHGYGSYGDETTYSDPWDSGYGSLGSHSVSTSGLNPCLQDRGMVW